ncbi:MFS transporter [Trueperella sp. LYQ141]|uniref:MFS transporter n=1 Tax=Trueperella sp. LYQ141 TaxID=3391058 RepID=UPI003983977D
MSQDVKLPREIWVLVAAAVCVSLGYGIVAPVLPLFAGSFGVKTYAATAVVSAFACMRLAFAPASGWLSKIFGERHMYMTGMAVVASSSALSGLSQNYVQLLIFRSIGGIGSVMFTVAAMSLIIKLAPSGARGRASAAYGSGFLIGNILGPAIGAFLEPFGFRAPFFIYTVLLLIAGSIVGVLVPYDIDGHEPHHWGKHYKEKQVAPTERPTRESISVSEALAIPRFRIALVTAFAQGWTNMGVRVAIVPIFAAYLVKTSNAPSMLPGLALMVFAVGNGIALAFAGRWSDVYGRKPVIVVGLILSGVFTVTMGVWATTFVVLIGSFLGGFGSGCIQPSQQGTVADIIGRREGNRVVSFFQQSTDLGQILGPLLAGFLVDHSGFSLAYISSGAILLVAAVAWIVAVRGHWPRISRRH